MKDNKVTSILFCGIGGQGILKAAEICCLAAMYEGFHVKKSEVHGMAQRGGSVESHVRFGRKVYSPLIGQGEADILLSTDEIERESYLDYLNPQSIDLTEYLKKGKEKIDNVFYLNTFMLGILSKKLNISEENWLKALKNILPAKALAENIEVFNQGRALV